jgi:hypothetical protein
MNAPRAARLLALAATLAAGGACTSESKRDQWFGTDGGANWVADDALRLVPRDASTAEAGDAGRDGGDAGDAGDAAERLDAAEMLDAAAEDSTPRDGAEEAG